MSSTMGSEQRAVKGHLYGVADQADPDGLSSITVADAIGGAGEAHRTVRVDDPQDLTPLGGLSWTSDRSAPIHLVVLVDQVPTRVRGDDDSVVGGVQQPVGRFDRDRLSGQMSSHVIAVFQDADAPGPIDPATDHLLSRCRLLFDLEGATALTCRSRRTSAAERMSPPSSQRLSRNGRPGGKDGLSYRS